MTPLELITSLRARGFRITKARTEIITLFTKRNAPLTVQDLLDKLAASDLQVNKTTVYRELDFLVAEKIISELDFLDGKKRYELLDEHHHHHLVCTGCKSVQCVEMERDLNTIEKKLEKTYKFTIKSHVLEFFGLCELCR